MALKMKTDTYDVNVTPDKRTIFVHEEKQIIEELKVTQLALVFFPVQLTFSAPQPLDPVHQLV